jgi:hypothetical protein
MRTLLASLFAVAALGGCAAVPGPYDYGYGGTYYYDAPAYYGYYDSDRYYSYGPAYYGGVVVAPSVSSRGVRQSSGDHRSTSRNHAVAHATPRSHSHTFSRNTSSATRQASRGKAKREKSRVAGSAPNDHGS